MIGYKTKPQKIKSTGAFIYVIISLFTLTYGDLYNNSDPIVLLNVSNFRESIVGTENAWIVEFYASWCGYCINYAPTWREFSFDVMDWDHTIKVAAMDCADTENAPICRDYEVTGYPTVKIFGAFTQKDDLGNRLKHGDSETMQEYIINFLTKIERENMAPSTWVDLLRYEGQMEKLFDHAPSEAENAVLIVDDSYSMISSQCILDLGNYKTIYVRKMDFDSPQLDLIDIRAYPAVIVVNKTGKYEILQNSGSTREEITAFLMNKFHLRRRKIELPGGSEHVNTEHDPPSSTLPTEKVSNADQVYMVDIENTLSYALRQEVAVNKLISEHDLQALVNFTNVLVKYLPTRPKVNSFLRKLNNFLKTKTSITGDEFDAALSNLRSSDSVLPDMQPWKGCLGSTSKYRGYPCGLWTLFHTLTVNAVIRGKNNPSYNPLEVVHGIHGYVKYFFTCDYCVQHFLSMYAEDAENFVKDPNDEILWFWKSHNKVNTRLKGDSSEDPQHVKQLFPTKERCPQCWKDENNFNQENVVSYLTRMYGESSISNLGLQDLSNNQKPNEQSFTYGSSSINISKFNHIVTSYAFILLYFKYFSH